MRTGKMCAMNDGSDNSLLLPLQSAAQRGKMCAMNDGSDNARTPSAGVGQQAVFAIAARGKP